MAVNWRFNYVAAESALICIVKATETITKKGKNADRTRALDQFSQPTEKVED